MKQDSISAKIKKLKEEQIKRKYQSGGMVTNPQQYSPYVNPLYGDFDIYNQPQTADSKLYNYFDFATEGYRAPVQPLNLQSQPTTQPSNTPTTTGVINQSDIPQANIQYNTTTQNRLANPYTGINLETALFTLGQSLGYEGENKGANTVRGAASAGKIALGGARTLLSGLGYQNRTDNTYNSFMENLYNPQFSYSYLQEGGQVSNADVMTGAYLVQNPMGNVNAEVEKGEVIKDGNTGNIQMVAGDTHENGGVQANLSNGTKVLSDYTKIGAKNAKLFKKEFDLKGIKASDTFATVMDKYNKSLGYTDLIKDEAKTIEQVEGQQEGDIDNSTKDINLNFLSNKLQGIEANKELMKPAQDEAFEKIFEEQEKIPKKGNDAKMQEGGQFDPQIMDLSQKYGIAPERVLELIQTNQQSNDAQAQITQALSQNVPPEEIISGLVQGGVPQDQAEAMVTQATQQMPVMQAGGTFYTPSPFAMSSYENQPFGSVDFISGNITSPEIGAQRIMSQSEVLPFTLRNSGLLTGDSTANLQSAENVKLFQTNYNDYLDKVNAAVEVNPNLTETQKTKLREQIGSEGFTNDGIRAIDSIYGNFTGSRGSFNLPLITEEEKVKYPQIRRVGDVFDEKGQIKDEYKDLSDSTKNLLKETVKGGTASYDIGVLPTPTEAQQTTVVDTQGNPTVIDRNVVNYSMPRTPQNFLLPPSAASPVYKAAVSLSQIDPTKISAEPNLIEIDRQSQAAQQALAYLPDSQRVAAMSSILGQSQIAANQAITNAEITNAQSAAQAQLYNAQVSDKQQVLDQQFAQDYEQKTFASQLASERDLRAYLNDLNLQQRYNFGYIDRRNAFNEAPLRYKITGDGLTFESNGNIVNQPLSTVVPNITSAEQKAIIAKRAAEAAKAAAKKK